jgi:hypothetical protein
MAQLQSTSITGSLIVTGGITGSLLGTSSFALTASYYGGSIVSASYAATASYVQTAQTASYVLNTVSASFASTASRVNTLNQSVLITGSLTVGATSAGASENTITLGARDASNEGGQIGFNAPGGTYTSASFIDNWQNYIRILRGNNTTSDGLVTQWNLHTKQMQLPAYTNASSFVGTATANLAVDSGGNVITVSTTGGTVFPYTGNAVITGSLTTTGIIYAQPNGGMYFQGGDDAALYDVNVVNTIGIYGVQDSTIGSIKLGSGGGTISGKSGNIGIGTINPTSASFQVNGNVWANSFTGSLLGTASYATTTISSSYAINATTANTASYVLQAVSASYALNSTNATNATNATNIAVTDTTTGTGPYYVMFADGTTGNRAARVDSNSLTFNATTNVLTVTSSYANQAASASYVLNAISASYATQALSSSYALSASYSRTASYAVTAGSTAAVAGTTNYVPKFTSGTAIGNSLIYETSSLVGIGTTNPGFQLDVNGWIGASRFYPYNSNSTYITGDGGGVVVTGTGYFYVPAPGGSYFEGNVRIRGGLSNDTAAYMQINGGTSNITYINGDLGVGISNPSPLLSGTERVIEISNSNVASLYLDSTTGRRWSVSSISNGALTFWDLDAVAERMRINTSGSVGIGTTTPAEKLSLAGSTGTTFGLSLEPSGWGGAKHRLTVPTSGDSSMWSFNWNGSAIDASYAPSAITLAQGLIQFYTTGSANVPAERMRIDGSGNVGIGTTSPSTKLDVNGIGKFGASAYIGTNIAQGYYQDSANGAYRALSGATNPGYYFQKYNGTATTMYVGLDGTYAGKVGIGTTSPTYDLHIARASSETGILTSFGSSDIYLTHGGWAMGAGKFGIGDGSTPTITFDTVNDRLGVGSGISNPAYLIDAYSTHATANIISIGGSTNYSLFQSFNNSGVFGLAIDNSAGSGYSQGAYSRVLHSTGAYPLVISTNSTERMRITDAGNVGIGTTSPSVKLHTSINNNAFAFGGLIENTNTGSNAIAGIAFKTANQPSNNALVAQLSSGDMIIYNTATSSKINFFTNSTQKMTINATGDVGIGTNAPAYKLHVSGNIGVSGDIVDNTNSYLKWNQGNSSFYAGGDDAENNLQYQPNQGISSISNYAAVQGWGGSNFNGQTLTQVYAGANITRGELVYLRSSDSKWYLANSAAAATSINLLGIALDDAAIDDTFAVLLDGIIITTQHTQNGTAASGAPLYIETSNTGNAGEVTEIAPGTTGEVVRLVGHNIFDTSAGVVIRFQPDNTWIEL